MDSIIVQNVAKSRRDLHQLLTRKQLHSALYGVYTEVIHDLTAVLKESAAIGETAKTTITTPHPKRNSASREDERGNFQTMSTKESRNQHHPPRE
jgi:hypothetical protein